MVKTNMILCCCGNEVASADENEIKRHTCVCSED